MVTDELDVKNFSLDESGSDIITCYKSNRPSTIRIHFHRNLLVGHVIARSYRLQVECYGSI